MPGALRTTTCPATTHPPFGLVGFSLYNPRPLTQIPVLPTPSPRPAPAAPPKVGLTLTTPLRRTFMPLAGSVSTSSAPKARSRMRRSRAAGRGRRRQRELGGGQSRRS